MKQNGIYNGDIRRTAIAGSDEQVVEPWSVDEAKSWGRIDVTDDDEILLALIRAARVSCERYLNMSLVPTIIEATILCQLGNYALPYGPVTSVTSLVDADSKAVEYTLKGVLFKSLVCQYSCPLSIVYEAGYTTVPEDIKTAIKQQLLYLYDNRGDETMITKMAPIVIAMLSGVRRVV